MHNKCPVKKLNRRRHQDVPLSTENHSQKILSFLAWGKATSDQRGWNKYAYLDSFQLISVESFLIKNGARVKTLRSGKVILEIIHPG